MLTATRLCKYDDRELWLVGQDGDVMELEFRGEDEVVPFTLDTRPATLDMDTRYISVVPEIVEKKFGAKGSDCDHTIEEFTYKGKDVCLCTDGALYADGFKVTDPEDEDAEFDTSRHDITLRYPSVMRILRSPAMLDRACEYAVELGNADDFFDYVEYCNYELDLANIYEGLFFAMDPTSIRFGKKEK